MTDEFPSVFARLREILGTHSKTFEVGHDTNDHYSLIAPVGPATLRAWRGKLKSSTIPVAWVQIGKSYVSYHLMGVYGNPKLLNDCSDALRARMQGKSCFNFRNIDEPLFREIRQLTVESLACMRRAGFISEP